MNSAARSDAPYRPAGLIESPSNSKQSRPVTLQNLEKSTIEFSSCKEREGRKGFLEKQEMLCDLGGLGVRLSRFALSALDRVRTFLPRPALRFSLGFQRAAFQASACLFLCRINILLCGKYLLQKLVQ
jgi:hypothetical protein